MPLCEMCGYEGYVTQAIVEGTMLGVCAKCVKYGEVIQIKKPSEEVVAKRLAKSSRHQQWKARQTSEQEIVVRNCAVLVKKARQKMGKTQQEVAQAIAERSSVIQRVETGSLEPSLRLARKLQQYLRTPLVTREKKKSEDDALSQYSVSSDAFTIGDIIKRKK